MDEIHFSAFALAHSSNTVGSISLAPRTDIYTFTHDYAPHLVAADGSLRIANSPTSLTSARQYTQALLVLPHVIPSGSTACFRKYSVPYHTDILVLPHSELHLINVRPFTLRVTNSRTCPAALTRFTRLVHSSTSTTGESLSEPR